MTDIIEKCFPPTHPVSFEQLDGVLLARVQADDLLYDQELLLESMPGAFLVDATDREATIDTGKTVIHLVAVGKRP